MATRWGIASAGKISHDFATALGTLPAKEHKIVAVAARDLPRARAFAKLHDAGRAYGSYMELAQDPEVEVVYVGSLHTSHLEISKLMLQGGKHILCEKPLTMNRKQTAELLTEARRRGLFAMEGYWSRFFPAYGAVKKEIDGGAIGEVKHINVHFGFNNQHLDRFKCKKLGGSTILQMAGYTVQLMNFVFGGERPASITARGHLNDDGVDVSMAAIFMYENGRMATITCNATALMSNEALVCGTQGIIRIPNFWSPTRIDLPSGTFEMPLAKGRHKFNYFNSAGLRYEAEEVRACLKNNQKESPRLKHSESLLIAETQDELRRQIGVTFSVD